MLKILMTNSGRILVYPAEGVCDGGVIHTDPRLCWEGSVHQNPTPAGVEGRNLRHPGERTKEALNNIMSSVCMSNNQ